MVSAVSWTQEEIGDRLGVDQRTISLDTNNCHLAKIGNFIGEDWKGL